MSLLSAPYDKRLFSKHVLFYILIQVVIWIKVAIFYSLYGHGIVLGSFAPFSNPSLLAVFPFNFDWAFHQIMHLLIFFALFLFARQVKKPDNLQLAAFFAVAVVLHNVGYWLTAVFSGLSPLIFDALGDFGLLFIFFYLIRIILTTPQLFFLTKLAKD